MKQARFSAVSDRAMASPGALPAGFDGVEGALAAAVDTVDDLFVLLDVAGDFVVWNSRLVDLTGYTDDELAAMRPADLFESDAAARFEAALDQVRTTGTASVQADVLTEHGTRVPQEFTLSALEHDGDCHGVTAVGRELDAPGRAPRRSAHALDRITDGFYTLDTDWRFTYLNRRAESVFPTDAAQVLGEVIWEVFPEMRDSVYETAFRAAVADQTSQTFEVRYEPRDQWHEVRVYPDADGLSVFFDDVTLRHEHEAELEAATTLMHALCDGMPVGVLAENADRRVVEVNTSFFDLFGLEADPTAFHGRDCSALAAEAAPLFVDSEEFVDDIEATIEGGKAVLDHQLSLVDGRTFERSYVRLDAAETTIHLWVYRDVSTRIEYEAALQRQNDRLERFASVVSHDLRNPLSVARGYLDIAMQHPEDASFGVISRSLDRMDALIDDLLSLTRAGEVVSERQAVSVASTADHCGEMTGVSGRLTIDTDRMVDANPSKLMQLFENLFRNAVEHGGDDVRITVGDTATGFYVEDDGAGVPPSERNRVFDSGYSTRPAGTGLGLDIVSQVAETHDWTVSLTDGTDGGARFEVEL